MYYSMARLFFLRAEFCPDFCTKRTCKSEENGLGSSHSGIGSQMGSHISPGDRFSNFYFLASNEKELYSRDVILGFQYTTHSFRYQEIVQVFIIDEDEFFLYSEVSLLNKEGARMLGYHASFLRNRIVQAYLYLLKLYPDKKKVRPIRLIRVPRMFSRLLITAPKTTQRAAALRAFFSGEGAHAIAAFLATFRGKFPSFVISVDGNDVEYGFDARGPYRREEKKPLFSRVKKLVRTQVSFEELFFRHGQDPDLLYEQIFDLLASAVAAVEGDVVARGAHRSR